MIQERSYTSSIFWERSSFQNIWKKKIRFFVQCKITCKLWLYVLGYLENSSNLIIDFLIVSVFLFSPLLVVTLQQCCWKDSGWIFTKWFQQVNFVNERDLVNKLRWLPWGKLILADQSRPTHAQKILMMATVLRITSEGISQLKDWHMSKNKNSRILSYWFQRVPCSLV